MALHRARYTVRLDVTVATHLVHKGSHKMFQLFEVRNCLTVVHSPVCTSSIQIHFSKSTSTILLSSWVAKLFISMVDRLSQKFMMYACANNFQKNQSTYRVYMHVPGTPRYSSTTEVRIWYSDFIYHSKKYTQSCKHRCIIK